MIDSEELLENECIRYLLNECSDLRRIVRQLLSESAGHDAFISQTASSFDAQWEKLNFGDFLATDTSFMETIVDDLASHTGLAPGWFEGKKVLDAGCGSGRWSYALSSAGAEVTAFDLSRHGVEAVTELCSDFAGFTAVQGNILQGLPFEPESFDYVWSFGVLHHTGDTRLGVEMLDRMIKPGGGLFLMLYGEPGNMDEFREVNTYTRHRLATSAMTLSQKMEYCKGFFPEEAVNGWFDAISPTVNDLHTFEEVFGWLMKLGYVDIQRTTKNRNLFLTAWKGKRQS